MPPCLIKSPYLHCSFLYSIFKEKKKKGIGKGYGNGNGNGRGTKL
jgi:hypothetical protein